MIDERRPTLYLVDGPNLAFRAFFAVTAMANGAGLPTNALFGFTNMLLKLIRDQRPDYLAVAWDPKGGSFRQALYPDYKGTRPDMPFALSQQMPHFQRVVEAFAVPFLCLDGFEADDVIGTLAHRHQGELEVVVITSDKDMMQLVSEHVSLLDTMKDKRISFAEVRDKFGCGPELVPDALGIWGDTSDNIPGVKGIGEKGVHKLLERWRGLDDLYAHLDEVEPKGVRDKLAADRDSAYLSRDLATIRTDAPVEVSLDHLALVYPPPPEAPRELFRELEFRGLLRELGGAMAAVSRERYELVTSEAALAAVVATLRAAGRCAVDTETTSLDPLTADLVGLSLCSDDHVAWYVPVAHHLESGESQLAWATVRSVLGPLLTDPTFAKIGQNLKFDARVLARHGVELAGIAGDTLLADYLLAPDRRSHKLDDLALVHLEHTMITFEETVGDGQTFADVPLERARDYAAEDAHVVWLLDEKLGAQLAEQGLEPLYREVEVPLISVLARMEQRGIALDSALLRELSVELATRVDEAERRCHSLAGRSFNVGSVKQLREILFDELKLPAPRSGKTGPSTDETVLSELALQHELPRAILDYRSLVKLKNTYVDPLPTMVSSATGRIHTHFSQTTAATGRLASTDPNLQNIPIRTAEGRRIRQAFVAPPGRVLLSADYSQVELRLLAHLVGGEGGFAAAFAAGRDVHQETAASLFGVERDAVSREMRAIAKAVNFGIVYGQSAFGLAQTQGISRPAAADYIRRYNERFPEIEAFRQRVIADARRLGYVTTILGRKRPVAELDSANAARRNAAERVAVNTPVQGSAADLIKLAMIAVDRRLSTEQPGQHLLLQVHDELLLEVDEARVDEVTALVREEMTAALALSVPLVVDVGVGHNWDEAH